MYTIEKGHKFDRAKLAQAIYDFARTKPGFDKNDYDSMASYSQDYRVYKRDADFNRNFDVVYLNELLDRVDDEWLWNQLGGTKRLRAEQKDSGYELDYIAGQYYPTEYQTSLRNFIEALVDKAFKAGV